MAKREQADSARTAAEREGGPGGGALVTEGSDAVDAPRVLRGEEFSDAVMRSLILAAKDAHFVAYQTGTGVVTLRNGAVAVVAPDPAMYKDLIPPAYQESRQP